MRTLPPTIALGQAGVHRVCSELLLRGIGCYLPLVDIGADIQLVDGQRIQVKAGRLRAVRNRTCKGHEPSLGPAYRFCMSRTFKGNYNQGSWRKNAGSRPFVLRKYSDETDFVVLWGIDEDRFWVSPATMFDQRQGLVLFPRGHRAPQTNAAFAPFSSVIHSYEGRWDLLAPPAAQGAVSTLQAVGGVS